MQIKGEIICMIWTLLHFAPIDSGYYYSGYRNGNFRCPRNLRNGYLFSDPENCNFYYVCQFVGTAYESAVRMSCPAGLHFNQRLRVCDYPENAGCMKRRPTQTSTKEIRTTTTPSYLTTKLTNLLTTERLNSVRSQSVPTDTTAPYSNPSTVTTDKSTQSVTGTTETKKFRCPRNLRNGYLFSDPENCNFFYVCQFVGTAYESAVRMSCPAGLHFNQWLRVCDYPENAGCMKRPTQSSTKERRTTTPSYLTTKILTTEGLTSATSESVTATDITATYDNQSTVTADKTTQSATGTSETSTDGQYSSTSRYITRY